MKAKERQQAIELRNDGTSVREIASLLHVSKSSVSRWVRDVVLSEDQLKRLEVNKSVGRIRASFTKKLNTDKRHQLYREEGAERARCDPGFRNVCCLYWGEGSKGKNTFSLTNCSAPMLKVVGDWLVREGHYNRLSFYVSFHETNGNNEQQIKQWWKEQLPWLKDSHFRKLTRYGVNRASQQKGIGKQPFGTARIYLGNTRLLQSIYGGIEYIQRVGL